MRTFYLIPLMALAAVSAARAQSVDDLQQREAAVYEAWNKAPLTIHHAVFVSAPPDGFGEYVARDSNVFKAGEKMVTYLEPTGYGWKRTGDDSYQFGFAVDFVLKSPDGKILTGQEDFAKLVQTSHARNREFMVTLTLNVSGAPAGDYILEYKLRDITSDKSASVSLPFKLVD